MERYQAIYFQIPVKRKMSPLFVSFNISDVSTLGI